ncbi:MAG: DUF2169 domain-containing protein [Gammaproteobacteria bacterium]
MKINNYTNYKARVFYGYDFQNNPQYTLVIKANYQYNSKGNLYCISNGESIFACDFFRDKYNNSSIVAAEESMPYKCGSEFIVYAKTAVQYEKLKIAKILIGVNKHDYEIEKGLVIFPKRIWKKKFFKYRIKSLGFLESIPITYEHAFGGVDQFDSSKVFNQNPIGKGFSYHTKSFESLQLPLIENIDHQISSPKDKPNTVGLTPIPKFYEPRLQTCIDRTANQFNVAPLDQQFKTPFLPGDEIYFSGIQSVMHAGKNILFVPNTSIHVLLNTIKNKIALSGHCDTLILNANANTLSLVFRYPIVIKHLEREVVININS